MPKLRKPKSKRVPVRLRHKIEKASSAKQRKDRKKAKNDPTWRTRLKKDPGIPNLFPYKDRILKEIEDGKRRKEEEMARRREIERAQRTGAAVKVLDTDAAMVEDEYDSDALLDLEGEDDDQVADMNDDDSANPMAALLASARARAAAYDPGNASDDDQMDDDEEAASEAESTTSFPHNETTTSSKKTKDMSRRAYAQTVNNLISSSDILLYVLDARDPQSTRSAQIEQAITADPNRRLILILNKIDLVPAEVLKGWLLHLRRSFLTLPLRASSSAPAAKTFDHKHLTSQLTASVLIKALKAYSTSRASTTVGILGYPNVGKSSVVNTLISRFAGKSSGKGSHRECPVGAEAGVTTALREVKLDGKITLVDSPGVVFPPGSDATVSDANILPATTTNGSSISSVLQAPKSRSAKDVEEHARLVLLNAIPPREIADPIPAVTLLLRRLSSSEDLMQRLLEVYDLPPLMVGPNKDVTTDFLVQVARKRGRLGKGGVPNLHAAAQTVIGDWRDGRIQGWVEAPKIQFDANGRAMSNTKNTTNDTKQIVTEWAKEFKIEGLWGDDNLANQTDDVRDVNDVRMALVS